MDDPSKSPIQVPSSKPGLLSTPLSWHGWPTWLVYFLTFLSVIYILNPTLGVFELLPDNLPIIGNLDEGAAFLMIWWGLIEFFEGRKRGGPPPTK